MSTFKNKTASDSQREAFLAGQGALIESDGDDYTLFFKDADLGSHVAYELNAATYQNALHEACNALVPEEQP